MTLLTALALSVIAFGIFRRGAVLPLDRGWIAVAALLLLATLAGCRLWFASPRASLNELRSHPALVSLVFFTLWAALSSWWSLDSVRSLHAASLVAGGIAYYAVGSWLSRRSMRFRPMLPAFLSLVGAAVAAASLVGLILGLEGWIGADERGVLAAGPFGYPNALAGALVLTLPSGVGLLISEIRRGRSQLAFVAALAALIAVQVGALG